MTIAATYNEPGNTTEATLFVACALREKTWKLGFTTGHGQKLRERTVPARQQECVREEIAYAKRRLGLPDTAPVVSCYEAGREGSAALIAFESVPPRAAPAAPAACPHPPVLAMPGSAGWRGRAAEGHGSEGRRPPVEKTV